MRSENGWANDMYLKWFASKQNNTMGPTRHHSLEIAAYFIIWTAGVFYSIYQVHLTSNFFSHDGNAISSDDFIPGWSVLDRKKDNADFEWKTWVDFLLTLTPWLAVHLTVAELVRYFHVQLLPYWYFIISIYFSTTYIGLVATAIILIQPCIFFVILRLRSRLAVWSASAALLAALNTDFNMEWLDITEVQQYFLFVCIAWTHLRCLSFCFDQLSESSSAPTAIDFIYFLSYAVYLPTMFLGPIILYSTYKSGLLCSYEHWTMCRAGSFLLSIARFVGWLLFTEFALHFVYCNALIYQPMVVARLTPWPLCGLGYCMGQFFMNKYVVFFGLAATVARAEQIEAPRHPKCIGRIHLYSDMWKHFDRGLYKFLVRYIFIPCLGTNPHVLRRLGASFVCFCFIYVWHRTYSFILVWSALNFLGVTIEGFAKVIQATERYQAWQKMLGRENSRRLHALIASPLFAMSCVSNFYFFGGMEIGNIFAKKFTEDGFLNVYVIFFCYCCCQVSTEVKIWEEQRVSANHPS